TIEKPKITAATGLYNVVRQVFGSVGIAVAATSLTHGRSEYRAVLAEHVTAFDPAARSWLEAATAGMRAAGADALTASRRALELLDLELLRQAAVLAYNHVFVLVTFLFAASLPLVLFLSNASGGEPTEVMVE